jgi:hypothetical protein
METSVDSTTWTQIPETDETVSDARGVQPVSLVQKMDKKIKIASVEFCGIMLAWVQ